MSVHRIKVLLSASIPNGKRSKKYHQVFTKIKDAQIQIEEAVISLSRNIFQAGGQIIFGGHPSISPLVTMVATEFKTEKGIENFNRNERYEKSINIFQSEAYRDVIPKETTGLFDLGYSEILWTEAIDNEKYDSNIKDRTQCEQSLYFMRQQMMKGSIDALVCIGGMEGVEQEFDLFRELHPNKPVFLLKSTGGASKILADKFSENNTVKVIDDVKFSFNRGKDVGEGNVGKFDIIPYSYITALIVKEILDGKNN